MNKQKWILFVAALLMTGGTVGVLARMSANQKLGQPGVRTQPLTNSQNLEVLLPEFVGDYSSKSLEQQKIVLDSLPKDTSFGQRVYQTPAGFWVVANVVLMGSDRTSIHKPEICLTAQGYRIDSTVSKEETLHIDRPQSYDLPVNKLIATKVVEIDGQQVTRRAIYMYWFVAQDAYTARHWQRMWWMAQGLMSSGVLQRWAYVSYFAVCAPGQEDATFERMKKLIVASVPEFQLTPKPGGQAALVRP